MSFIGIDSRIFQRTSTKRDGSEGHFKSVMGVAVKVWNYNRFKDAYNSVMDETFGEKRDYFCYCYNDIKDRRDKKILLDSFTERISPHINKLHVFYTLFSKQRNPEVKVYGRLSREKHIKLAKPTRTYDELVNGHISQCFPAICAWRICDHLVHDNLEYHLDYYNGHIFEAQEQIEERNFLIKTFPHGDCCNPIISTADLMLEVIDYRLADENKFLVFDNIRRVLPEFGSKTLVYPIHNKHLKYITPLEKRPVDVISKISHPVFWVFKGNSLMDSGTLKRSKTYRNMIDFSALKGGVVKMFEKGKDIEFFQEGDYGVYLDSQGKEIIESYISIGKKFQMFDLKAMAPEEYKAHLKKQDEE